MIELYVRLLAEDPWHLTDTLKALDAFARAIEMRKAGYNVAMVRVREQVQA